MLKNSGVRPSHAVKEHPKAHGGIASVRPPREAAVMRGNSTPKAMMGKMPAGMAGKMPRGDAGPKKNA